MARPRKAAVLTEADVPTPAVETPAPETTEAPVRRRRRRRSTAPAAPDYAQETVLLVEAALKSRGAKGATQDVLAGVVAWARGVRAEGEDLKVITSRPRRQKNQAAPDRVSTYEMNRALLDGILTGGITIDIRDDGQLIFLSTTLPAVPAVEAAPELTPTAEDAA